uniref:Uncharacterized protein n=1 Tax=Serinus canaria TaxID=9135 RepID=A0A8C9L361_SERCA
IIRDVRIRAHLCPFLSKGIISCFVTRLINHSWRVESRLVIQRLSSEGIRRAGNVIEIRMSGIPSRDGLENWSKNLLGLQRGGLLLVGGSALKVVWMLGLCRSRMLGL